jgi:hypothetical protein
LGQQSITVRVGGKSYPMTVDGPGEEETVRKAETVIRERMAMYERQYGIRDVRDLLSMCLLQFATEAIEGQGGVQEMEQRVADRLRVLEGSLDAALV